jgi:hypothetical protein
MRSSWAAGVLVVVVGGAARADVPADYPTEIVDRPLATPDGMSTADVGLSSSKSSAARDELLDFGGLEMGVSHAFQHVAPYLGLDVLAWKPNGSTAPGLQSIDGGAVIALDEQDVIYLGGVSVYPAEPPRDFTLHAALQRKVVALPHQLAFKALGGVFFEFFDGIVTDPSGFQAPLHAARLGAYGAATAELQLGPRVAFTTYVRGRGPIAHSQMSPAVLWGADVSGEITYAFDRADLYAQLVLQDVSRTADPYLAVGGGVRF